MPYNRRNNNKSATYYISSKTFAFGGAFMKNYKKESKYQHDLIEKIKDRFPNAFVLKNDPSYIQGIPDLTVLWEDKWATLECKKSKKDYEKDFTPNQHIYVKKMDRMSFSSFIYPENEEEVLNEMEQSFKRGARRSTRNLRCK